MNRANSGKQKVTSSAVATKASAILRTAKSPAVKSVAASDLAQARGGKKKK